MEIIDTIRSVKENIKGMEETIKETVYQKHDLPYKIDEKEGIFIDYDLIKRDDPRIMPMVMEGATIHAIFKGAMKKKSKFSIDLIDGKILIKINDEEVYRK